MRISLKIFRCLMKHILTYIDLFRYWPEETFPQLHQPLLYSDKVIDSVVRRIIKDNRDNFNWRSRKISCKRHHLFLTPWLHDPHSKNIDCPWDLPICSPVIYFCSDTKNKVLPHQPQPPSIQELKVTEIDEEEFRNVWA